MKVYQRALTALLVAVAILACLGYLRSMEESLENQLFKAIEQRDTERVKELIAAGANVNAKNEFGWPPLHTLASMSIYSYDVTELIQLLLNAGANVNALSGKGFTALHWAAQAGKSDLVIILLQAGADPTITISQGNNKGKTPLDMTVHNNIKKLLSLYPTPQEIKSIITALAVFTQKGQYHLLKDLRKHIMKYLLVQNLIDEKLERAQKELPEYTENELREIIESSVIKALSRSHAGSSAGAL